jgi:hypothetical protein
MTVNSSLTQDIEKMLYTWSRENHVPNPCGVTDYAWFYSVIPANVLIVFSSRRWRFIPNPYTQSRPIYNNYHLKLHKLLR